MISNALSLTAAAASLSMMPALFLAGDAPAETQAASPGNASNASRSGRPEPAATHIHERAHISDREVDCIASAIWHEARGEPKRGQIAIAEVVLTRTRNVHFPAKPCAVIAQRHQFSFVRRGRIPNIPDPAARDEMRRLARRVISGAERSGLRGATFFRANYVQPNWSYRRIGSIGGHIFYAWTEPQQTASAL